MTADTCLSPTEKYAQHWCSQLTDAGGPFAQCHATVSPSTYYSVMPAHHPPVAKVLLGRGDAQAVRGH